MESEEPPKMDEDEPQVVEVEDEVEKDTAEGSAGGDGGALRFCHHLHFSRPSPSPCGSAFI
jgi:hypothetical protein